METKKSQDLQPASWRTKKASAEIQSKSKDWRINVIRHSSQLKSKQPDTDVLRQEKMNIPAQATRAKFPFYLFVLVKPSMD